MEEKFFIELRSNIIDSLSEKILTDGELGNIDKLLSGYDFIVSKKKDRIYRKTCSGKNSYKKNFLLEIFFQTQFSRIIELLSGIADAKKQNLTLNEAILCRSLYETLTQFFYFLRQIEKDISNKNYKDFHFKLWSTFGSIRDEDEDMKKKSDKDIEGWRHDHIRLRKLTHVNDALRYYKENSRNLEGIKLNEEIYNKYFSDENYINAFFEGKIPFKKENKRFIEILLKENYSSEEDMQQNREGVRKSITALAMDYEYRKASQITHPNPLGTYEMYRDINPRDLKYKEVKDEVYKIRDINNSDFNSHHMAFSKHLLFELMNAKSSIEFHEDFMKKNYAQFIKDIEQLDSSDYFDGDDLYLENLQKEGKKYSKLFQINSNLTTLRLIWLHQFMGENKIYIESQGLMAFMLRYFIC